MSCNTTPFVALASHKALTAKVHPTWPRHHTPRPTWSLSQPTARATLALLVTSPLATTRSCRSPTFPARLSYLSTHTHLLPEDPMAEKKAQLWAPWRSWRAGSGQDWVPGRRTRLLSICTLIRLLHGVPAGVWSEAASVAPARCHHPITTIHTDNLIAVKLEQARPH